jgi:hypothetical protein
LKTAGYFNSLYQHEKSPISEMEDYMIKRRPGPVFVLCLFFLAGASLQAATVSFLVIETGLPAETEASQHSSLWESGLLDVFFEAGHIVSNAPIMRLSGKPAKVFPDEAKADLDEALEGGAEYFILALLDYASSAAADIQKPTNIALRLFKTKPHKLIFEQQYADKSSQTLNDEFTSLKQAVRGLIPHLNDR